MDFPPGVRHEIVKVVAPERGTVAAPPESACSLKLVSDEVMVHESTFFAFQKTVVRAPKGTEGGTAQMSTFGSPTGVVVAAGSGAGGTLFFAGGAGDSGGGGGGVPTW